MKESLQKKPWIIVLIVLVTVGIAVFSFARNFGSGSSKTQRSAETLKPAERLQQEKDSNDRLRALGVFKK
jgi:hypothetical protein